MGRYAPFVTLAPLIRDLALILMTAGFVTILFRKLGQPVVLGYVLAGLLVSPHFPIFFSVADPESIHVWGEIGVTFLFFSLGLEFSFRKLARIGLPSTVTAVTEVGFTLLLGYLAGHILGWSDARSLFLGGILAISSTSLILRILEERDLKGRKFADLVLGVLVAEDVVAVLLMLILTTISASQKPDGVEIVSAMLRLGVILVIWFLGGILLLPSLMRRVRTWLSDETLLIASLGLCFGMVMISAGAGFSPALGAFVIGSILGETPLVDRIENVSRSVRDLFAAIFFVSVGMQVHPELLVQHVWLILGLSLLVIFGKSLGTLIGGLLAGQSLRTSIESGLVLGQIGEFSFVIAGIGAATGVTPPALLPIAVGVSVVTAFVMPHTLGYSTKFASLVEKILPARAHEALALYQANVVRLPVSGSRAESIKRTAIRIISCSAMIIAIFLFAERILVPWSTVLGLTVAVAASAPFFWALMASRAETDTGIQELLLHGLRLLVGFLLLTVLLARFAPIWVSAGGTFLSVIGIWVLFQRHWRRVYMWLENRFVDNLSEMGRREKSHRLAPWDAHIARITVMPESSLVGKALGEAAIREHFGVTIALIERGRKKITAPGRDEHLYPGDHLFVIGTDEQIDHLRLKAQGDVSIDSRLHESSEYSLEPFLVQEESPFVGRTIRGSGLREETSGLVVGVERSGVRFLNPDSSFQIQANDLVWVVGESKKIRALSLSDRTLSEEKIGGPQKT